MTMLTINKPQVTAQWERRMPAKNQRILPLENGDRLTRNEFERRYVAMPHNKRVELLEGVVYMGSPVHAAHSSAHSDVMTWLGLYRTVTPGVKVYDNATVRLDADNEVQPDALMRLEPEHGGHSRISSDDYIEGAPELIIEVAASSAAYDSHLKKQVYRHNGVQEYVIWQCYEARIEWYRIEEGDYVAVLPDEMGIIHSTVFPGLQLAVTPLLAGDLAQVLAVLNAGTQSAEHTAFMVWLTAIQ